MFVFASGANDRGDEDVTLEALFMFWTGAREVPPGGFQVDNNPIHPSIAFFTKDEPGRLPSSSTCGLVLYLPRGITDKDLLRQELTRAILESGGFGRV